MEYFFTEQDFTEINKKRSKSFAFTRHKKLSKPSQKLLAKRYKSWGPGEFRGAAKLQPILRESYIATAESSRSGVV